MANIIELKDGSGVKAYPITKGEAVYYDDTTTINDKVNDIKVETKTPVHTMLRYTAPVLSGMNNTSPQGMCLNDNYVYIAHRNIDDEYNVPVEVEIIDRATYATSYVTLPIYGHANSMTYISASDGNDKIIITANESDFVTTTLAVLNVNDWTVYKTLTYERGAIGISYDPISKNLAIRTVISGTTNDVVDIVEFDTETFTIGNLLKTFSVTLSSFQNRQSVGAYDNVIYTVDQLADSSETNIIRIFNTDGECLGYHLFGYPYGEFEDFGFDSTGEVYINSQYYAGANRWNQVYTINFNDFEEKSDDNFAPFLNTNKSTAYPDSINYICNPNSTLAYANGTTAYPFRTFYEFLQFVTFAKNRRDIYSLTCVAAGFIGFISWPFNEQLIVNGYTSGTTTCGSVSIVNNEKTILDHLTITGSNNSRMMEFQNSTVELRTVNAVHNDSSVVIYAINSTIRVNDAASTFTAGEGSASITNLMELYYSNLYLFEGINVSGITYTNFARSVGSYIYTYGNISANTAISSAYNSELGRLPIIVRDVQQALISVTITANSHQTIAVTFPRIFKTTPLIFGVWVGDSTSPDYAHIGYTVTNTTNTGFTLHIYGAPQMTATRAPGFRWIAIDCL